MSATEADSMLGERWRAAVPIGLLRLGGESIRYLAVSAVALGCDVAVYAGLVSGGTRAAAAGAVGYAIGLIVHYALSARWVFPDAKGTRRTAPTLVKFVATGFIGLATTAAIIDGLTRNHVAGAFSAKAAAVVTAYVIVFLLRRTYVFAAGTRSHETARLSGQS
jgi:putative flippase GtrA